MKSKNKRDFDQLHNKLKNDFITKVKTNSLVTETVKQESNQLNRRISTLTGVVEESIDDLYFNHVAVPGLIC